MQSDNQKIRRGVVTHFIKERNFGFIKSRDPLTGKVETYFIHIANIDYCEPEYPGESDVVAFEVSSIPPKPGKYPLADHAYVYKKPEMKAAPNTLAGIDARAGEPGSQNGDKAGAR